MTDTMTDTDNLRSVLVTTAHCGVFFGYADPDLDLTEAKTIALVRARNCLYWPAETRGFLGLATAVPAKNARVGPPADIVLLDVTCIARVEPAAVAAWESAPWQS